MMVEPGEPEPFPDIPAEVPGMLTKLEEACGVDEVVQDEPEQSDEQRAMLTAENLGLDFSSIPTKVSGGEVIEILDDEEEDAIDEYEQAEVLVKMELDREGDRAKAGAHDGSRRSNRGRIANQQFEDYELYVTVEEEELMRETAVTKELNQFNKYGVFEPKHARDLSDKEKNKALSLLIFLKEKKSGNIKARSCANGNKQREHIAKEEAAAPTVALESVFITLTIDAKESRKVVTIDIPGAFLHADNEDYMIMKMVGTLAELLVKTNPRLYRQYVNWRKENQCSTYDCRRRCTE
jgi:hypothetical protein